MANLTGFKSDNKGLFIIKDPQANVQYGLDWSDWLPAGDSLSSCTVTIETISGDAAPLALPTNAGTDVTITGGITNIRVDGGTDVTITGAITNIRLNAGTAGNIYNIRAKVVTAEGNTDARHFRIVVEDKQA